MTWEIKWSRGEINCPEDIVFGYEFDAILAEAIENYIDYLDYKLGRLPERYNDE